MEDYYYSISGRTLGPTTEEHLIELVQNRELDPRKDLVWKEGMAGWLPVSDVLTIPQTPPPLPPPVETPAAEEGNLWQTPRSALQGEKATLYPIPPVKTCSFPLLAGLTLLSTILSIAGDYRSGFMKAFSKSMSEDPPRMPDVSGMDQAGLLMLGLGVLINIAGLVLGLVYLHRAWAVIQPGHPHTTPGKAVGYLFVPFYQVYWYFVAYYGWSHNWNRITARYQEQGAPRMISGLFLANCILFIAALFQPFFGIPSLVVGLLMNRQMCEAVNYMAARRQA